MKVIAIKDAPLSTKGYTHRGKFYDKAYSRGDVFDIWDNPNADYLEIYHDKLEMTMDVDPDNFITLREYREQQLNNLLNK